MLLPQADMIGSRARAAYFAAFIALALAVAVAATMHSNEVSKHRALYDDYTYANALLEGHDFQGASQIYMRLAKEYPTSYILEMKLCVCALNLEDYETALFHGERAVGMDPLLLLDVNIRDALAMCYESQGDSESANMLRAYDSAGVNA